jgi:hypothetical protein
MVPFWGRQMFIRVGLLAGLSIALLVTVWSISQGSGQTGAQAKASPGRGTQTERDGPAKDSRPVTPAPTDKVPGEKPVTPAPPDKTPKENPVVPAGPDKAPEEPKPVPPPEVKRDPPPEPRDIRGTVRAVDAKKRALTLAVRDKGAERETVYQLAPDARLSLGRGARTLADVRRGTRVRAVLGDGNMIVELRSERSREGEGRPDMKRPRSDD